MTVRNIGQIIQILSPYFMGGRRHRQQQLCRKPETLKHMKLKWFLMHKRIIKSINMKHDPVDILQLISPFGLRALQLCWHTDCNLNLAGHITSVMVSAWLSVGILYVLSHERRLQPIMFSVHLLFFDRCITYHWESLGLPVELVHPVTCIQWRI